jgi:uncharacterized tellurite resistance protein B-like protein
MNAEDIRELQDKVIEVCHASGTSGMPEERLKRALLRAGYGVDQEALGKQLKYLKGEGLITNEEDRLRPDLQRWFSTSEGDKHLMRAGLI